jgi:hypothetical protein
MLFLEPLEERALPSGDYTNFAAALPNVFYGLENAINHHLWSPPGQPTYQFALPIIGTNLQPAILQSIGNTLLPAIKGISGMQGSGYATNVVAPTIQNALSGSKVNASEQNSYDEFEITYSSSFSQTTNIFDLGLPALENSKLNEPLLSFLNGLEKSSSLPVSIGFSYAIDLHFRVGTDGSINLDTTPNNTILTLTSFDITASYDGSSQLGSFPIHLTVNGSMVATAIDFNVAPGLYPYPGKNNPIDVLKSSHIVINGAAANLSVETQVDTTDPLTMASVQGLDATLTINWNPGNITDPFDDPNTPGPTISFDVSSDMSLLTDFLYKDVVQKAQDTLSAIKPIVDTLHHVLDDPVPILGDITGLTLKQILDASGVTNVDDLDNFIGLFYNFLHWTPSAVPAVGNQHLFTVTLPDFRNPGSDLQSFLDNNQGLTISVDQNQPAYVKTVISSLTSGLPGSELELPVLSDPLSLLKAMALGENVVLVQYQFPPLRFPNLVNLTVPLPFSIGPLGVSLVLSCGFNADITFGYDSYGFTQGSGSAPGVDWHTDLTNPNFVISQPAPAKFKAATDLPEGVFVSDPTSLKFTGSVGLVASANFVVATLKGGGTVNLEAGIDSLDLGMLDPGKNTAITDDPYHVAGLQGVPNNAENVVQLNDFNWDLDNGGPLCAFKMSGAITLQFSASVKIGVDPISHTFTADLGSITLANFNIDPCAPPKNGPHLADSDTIDNKADPNNSDPHLLLPGIISQVKNQLVQDDPTKFQNIDPTSHLVLLDLGGYAGRAKNVATGQVETFEVSPYHEKGDPSGQNSGLLVSGFTDNGSGNVMNIPNVNNSATTVLVFGDPNQDLIDTVTVDQGVQANAYFHGGTGPNKYLYQGDGDTYMKGGAASSLTPPPGTDNAQNTIIGGNGVNYLVGGDLTFLHPSDAVYSQWNVLQGGEGPNSHNVEQGGTAGATLYAGPNDGDQLTGGSPNQPTSYYALHAGKGFDHLIGGGVNAQNEFDWNEKDGSVDVTGGANHAFDIKSPGDSGNTCNIAAATPDESWDIGTSGQDIVINVPNSSKTITTRGLQVLNLDDSPGTANPNPPPTITYPKGTNIKYDVDDLSKTGIGLVQVNLHEQDNPDVYNDQVLVRTTNVTNTVALDVIPPLARGHGPLTEVTIGTMVSDQRVTYYVQTAIPKPPDAAKPHDTLIVNTFTQDDTSTKDGNDTVKIDATQANVDGTSTGGHVFVNTGNGDDTITVGNSNDGMDDIQGPLDIDAAQGHNKITFDNSHSTVNDTVTLTATQVIRATTAVTPGNGQPSVIGSQTGYPFIINYKASSGDFTPVDGSNGVIYETSRGSTNLYIPETGSAAPTEVDCNGGIANTHDNVLVGYDGQAQTSFPKTIDQSTLDHLHSILTVHGNPAGGPNPPYSVLEVDDETAPLMETYNLGGTAVPFQGILQRIAVSPVQYDNTALTLNAGNHANKVLVAAVPKFSTATVNAGNGTNQVFVGSRKLPPPAPPLYVLDGIVGLLTVNGGTGQTDLTIDDAGSDLDQAYLLSANQLYRFAKVSPPQPPVAINFSSLHSLVFDASDNASGTDFITVNGTAKGTPVVVNIGNGAASLAVNHLDQNQGSLVLNWSKGNKSLSLNDTAASVGAAYQLTNGSSTTTLQRSNAAQVTLNGFLTNWDLFPSLHSNVVRIETVAKGTSGEVVGLGQDSVFVADSQKSLDAVQGPLTVFGNGKTQVTLDDQSAVAGRRYQMTTSALQILHNPPPPPIQFFSLADVTLNAGPAAVSFIQATAAATRLTVNLGTGTNPVFVGSTNNSSSTLNSMQGSVFIHGQSGHDPLVLNDQSGPAMLTYTINASSMARTLAQPIHFQKMGGVTLFGGPVVQFYQVQGVPPTTPVTIKAQGGSNYLSGPNQDNAWNITAPDAGTLDKGKKQGIVFSGIQNLNGGSGNDDFVFQPSATLSGHLDGGLGTDTLDFSSYAQAVALAITQHGTQDGVQGTALLKSNNAPIVGGGFDDIESLIGNNGSVLNGSSFTGNFDSNLKVAGFVPFSLNVPGNFTGNLQAFGESIGSLQVGNPQFSSLSGSVLADNIGLVNIANQFLGQIVVSKSFGTLNAAFTAPDAHVWVEQAGSFGVRPVGALVGQQAMNLATVNDPNVADVTVQATLAQALATGQQAALVARYDAATNSAYLAVLQYAGNNLFTASIVLDQHGTLHTLKSASVSGPLTKLKFQVTGSGLQFFLNNALAVSATDSTLHSGGVGIQIDKGVALNDFLTS